MTTPARQSQAETAQLPFVRALLDPDLPVPPGLRSWNGSDPAQRFAVYRNNVVVSLVDALAEQFGVTRELVGDEFFRAMAREFVRRHPPRSRLLVFAGDSMADFVEGFAPAATVPYLADVVRLEMARIRSCHAADAPVLGKDMLPTVLSDPQRLAQAVLVLHPSVVLLQSRHAVFSLWAAHQGELDIAGVDPDEAQQVLVWRDGLDVETMRLAPAAYGFLSRLQHGDSLLQAANTMAAEQPDFDLPGALALLLRHPLLTRLESLP